MRFINIAATAILLSPVCATFGPWFDKGGLLSKPEGENGVEYYKNHDGDCNDKDGKKEDCDCDDKGDNYGHHHPTKPDLLKPDLPKPDLLNPDLLKPDLPKPDLPKPYHFPKSYGLKPGKGYTTASCTDNPKHPGPTEVAPPGYPMIVVPGSRGPSAPSAPPAPPAPPEPTAPTPPPAVVVPVPAPPPIVKPSYPAAPPPSIETPASSIVPVVVIPTPMPVPFPTGPPSNTTPPQQGNNTTPPPPTFTGTAVVSSSQCVPLLMTLGTVWLITVLL